MRSFLFLAFAVNVSFAFAQRGLDLRAEGDANTVMVRGFEGAEATEPALQAVWRLP